MTTESVLLGQMVKTILQTIQASLSSGFSNVSTFGPTPRHSTEIWAISQTNQLQIQPVYGARDPFQVCRPDRSHLPFLSIYP